MCTLSLIQACRSALYAMNLNCTSCHGRICWCAERVQAAQEVVQAAAACAAVTALPRDCLWWTQLSLPAHQYTLRPLAAASACGIVAVRHRCQCLDSRCAYKQQVLTCRTGHVCMPRWHAAAERCLCLDGRSFLTRHQQPPALAAGTAWPASQLPEQAGCAPSGSTASPGADGHTAQGLTPYDRACWLILIHYGTFPLGCSSLTDQSNGSCCPLARAEQGRAVVASLQSKEAPACPGTGSPVDFAACAHLEALPTLALSAASCRCLHRPDTLTLPQEQASL